MTAATLLAVPTIPAVTATEAAPALALATAAAAVLTLDVSTFRNLILLPRFVGSTDLKNQ